jgi:hypothetical protein
MCSALRARGLRACDIISLRGRFAMGAVLLVHTPLLYVAPSSISRISCLTMLLPMARSISRSIIVLNA